jgi:hypothetical protein
MKANANTHMLIILAFFILFSLTSSFGQNYGTIQMVLRKKFSWPEGKKMAIMPYF